MQKTMCIYKNKHISTLLWKCACFYIYGSSIKDFKTFIAKQSHVAFCYRISGDSCFLFKARFKTMQDVESFIDILQIYGHTKTHFIFSETI